MKITIDTKEDSHDEIKNVIKMLQHLVGENPVSNSPSAFESDSSEAPATNAFANMFGDDTPATPSLDLPGMNDTAEAPTPSLDLPGLNETTPNLDEKEEPEEKPTVEIYE